MASGNRVRYRATVAYDGTAYHGFQRQAGDAPTIQRALERAIAAVTGQTVAVTAAGRTDAGVHATGQVIAFDVNWRHSDEALLKAVNAHLPDDIALQDIVQHPGFHPRFDALSRTYRYTIVQAPCRQPLLRHRAWHVHGTLDERAMQAAAALLVGEHDFATFGRPPDGENTVRRVMASRWSKQLEYDTMLLVYRVEANAFLQHQVRRMVALMVEVGRGTLTVEEFETAFHTADLSQAGSIAPPQGLVLEAVKYS